MKIHQGFCTVCKRSWDSSSEIIECPYCHSRKLLRVDYERK